MKRAARHFGERLGNALYVKGNTIHKAPRTNKDALARLERSDALLLFGDQKKLAVGDERRPASAERQSPTSVTAVVDESHSPDDRETAASGGEGSDRRPSSSSSGGSA